jgi:amino acid transporter
MTLRPTGRAESDTPLIDGPAVLPRRFGLLQATALNMTNMIGVGPFITIPLLMSALGGPQAMLGWLVALLIVIPDGMVWSELGSAMPGSGGSYVYLREGYGPERWGRLASFLFIWQFILSGPLEIASGYIGFSQYLGYLWPSMTDVHFALVAAAIGVRQFRAGPHTRSGSPGRRRRRAGTPRRRASRRPRGPERSPA